MPAPVFYSFSPFGTGTIETGSGTIAIASGVATLTAEQTGNIGVGVEIEYNSLHAYIAPNRIGFDSGGTAELLLDTKIEGGTSGATGIVRFVEVISGTWAGGNAAGWIYFEKTTGTFQNDEQINRIKPTVSNNIATVDGTIEGNIGNGNTEFVVKSAIGADAANQTATAVTSIHHVWASLSAFDGAYLGVSYINNTNLTSADVVAHACWYYDHDDQTVDSTAAVILGATTDSTRFTKVFTPTGNAESINNQRCDGAWNANAAIMDTTSIGIDFQDPYGVLEGLQIESGGGPNNYGILCNGDYLLVDMCLIRAAAAQTPRYCIYVQDPATIRNTIAYNSDRYGIIFTDDTICQHVTCVDNILNGFIQSAGTSVVTNCLGFSNGEDFTGTFTCTYSASEDESADDNGGAGNIISISDPFTNYAGDDFSITSGSDVTDQGIDLTGSGIWRDIARNERGATPDIGAFEYVAVGGYTLTAESGSYSKTGQAVGLLAGRKLAIDSGALSITGTAAGLLRGYPLNAETGALSITGQDAGLIKDSRISLDSGGYSVAGQSVDLLRNYLLSIEAGNYVNTGQDVSLLKNSLIAMGSGAYDITGQDVPLLKGSHIPIDSGGYDITGQDTALLRGLKINIENGIYNLIGQDATLLRSLKIGIESGIYALSGQDVTLVYTPIGGYTLIADSGSYSITGTAVNLIRNFLINIENGSYGLTGSDVTLTYTPVGGYTLIADSGTYNLTGAAADLLRGYHLGIESGSFILSGQDVSLLRGFQILSESGVYNITGQAAALLHNSLLNAESGNYGLSGQAVSLLRGFIIGLESGGYSLTGQDITLLRNAVLIAQSGSYLLTGQDADLIYSGAITIIGCLKMIISSKAPRIEFTGKQPNIQIDSKRPLIKIDGVCGE